MDTRLSLKVARVNAGLTQQELAKSLKVAVSTVNSWETGRHAPNIYAYQKLCALLGVQMGDIFLPVSEV